MNHVEILLSTYNGEKYLENQINSILNQKNVDIHITARDDGSTDSTFHILNKYKRTGRLSIIEDRNNIGPARSFLKIIKDAPESDYYALCDQDDIWLENKLNIAIEHINKYSKAPQLYGGRPIFVNEELEKIPDQNPDIPHIRGYADGLIIRNMPGCTFVFNKALRDIVKTSNPQYLEMHDAWITQLCLLFEGRIFYDENVPMLYRQHKDNVAGGKNVSLKKWTDRFNRFFKKSENKKSRTAAELLNDYSNTISKEKTDCLERVAFYKKSLRSKLLLFNDKRFLTDSDKFNRDFKISVLLGIL